MTTIREDYIMRMIQMMGEVILASFKLRKAGNITEADQTLSDALLTIMPDHADLVEIVDEKTAITLLGNSQLIEAYIELLLERAELKIALNKMSSAEALQARAVRIFLRNLQRETRVSPKGFLIFGRLSGLELQLLLDVDEFELWLETEKNLESGLIGSL